MLKALLTHSCGRQTRNASAPAAELVRRKLDVIVGEAFQAVRALRRTTETTPVVFITGDPVTSGFVQSLAHPGGNLTGVANLSLELYPKRVELGARSDDAVSQRAYNQLARTVCPLPRRGRSWPQPLGLALRAPNQ